MPKKKRSKENSKERDGEEKRLAEKRPVLGKQAKRPKAERSVETKMPALKAGDVVEVNGEKYRVRNRHGGKVVMYAEEKYQECVVTNETSRACAHSWISESATWGHESM